MTGTQDQQPRLVRALLLAGVAGSAILGFVRYVCLPALARSMTRAQFQWLRVAFHAHPAWFMLAILALAGLLALPVLLVALWAMRAGPWRESRPSEPRLPERLRQ
jgi:hypothetical protein